jgi:hypothetical protein
MLPRITAFLLALLMLWSGLAVTEQRFAEALDLPEQMAGVSGDAKRSDINGSMDDHVVDDQPAQAFGEPLFDLPALMGNLDDTVAVLVAATQHPVPPADGLRAPPCLEGLQRPPARA